MEAQTPAEGVLQRKGGKSWKWYHVPCECGCSNYVDMMIEIDDPTDNIITCHISSQVKTAYWRERFPITYDESWFVMWVKETANRLWATAGICWTAISKGYVELESYTLLTQQQTLNMAKALQDAVAAMEVQQKENEAKKQASTK